MERPDTNVLIPTTADTGSEVSPSIVLADPEFNTAAATSDHLVADVAWIDPQLICSAPVNVTRDSGIDALTPLHRANATRFIFSKKEA